MLLVSNVNDGTAYGMLLCGMGMCCATKQPPRFDAPIPTQ